MSGPKGNALDPATWPQEKLEQLRDELLDADERRAWIDAARAGALAPTTYAPPLAEQLERCHRCGGRLGTPWCWDPACPGPSARLTRSRAASYATDEERRLEEARLARWRRYHARRRSAGLDEVLELLEVLEEQVRRLPAGAL